MVFFRPGFTKQEWPIFLRGTGKGRPKPGDESKPVLDQDRLVVL
jgi:hypothetical protein